MRKYIYKLVSISTVNLKINYILYWDWSCVDELRNQQDSLFGVQHLFQWIFYWSRHLWNVYFDRAAQLYFFLCHICSQVLTMRWVFFSLGKSNLVWWMWRRLHLNNLISPKCAAISYQKVSRHQIKKYLDLTLTRRDFI